MDTRLSFFGNTYSWLNSGANARPEMAAHCSRPAFVITLQLVGMLFPNC
jgi:hypothetical protein